LKLFFNFEIWTKINVQFSFFKKSFKIFILVFFRFFISRIKCMFMSILYNTEILEKVVQSIRKNLKKCDFLDIFPFFLDFGHF
jgi:predicted membrane channel-forming protein YqfA (hemolysin III family)